MTSSGLPGTWQSMPGGPDEAIITLVLAGSATSGTATFTLSLPVRSDMPTCRIEYVSTGSYAATASNITFTFTSGSQRGVGCGGPGAEGPLDAQTVMGYAMALSGAYTVSATTLTLPTYGSFTRK